MGSVVDCRSESLQVLEKPEIEICQDNDTAVEEHRFYFQGNSSN